MINFIERLFMYVFICRYFKLSRLQISLLGRNKVRENITTVLISEVRFFPQPFYVNLSFSPVFCRHCSLSSTGHYFDKLHWYNKLYLSYNKPFMFNKPSLKLILKTISLTATCNRLHTTLLVPFLR